MATTSSRVKLFEKKLAEVDIHSGLVLEEESLVHPPEFNSANNYVDFKAVDEDRTVWSFRCYTECMVGGIATKPVVLGGWCEFVRHHRLRVKDKVIFYDNDHGDGVPFTIHIRRTIRLFGVDITQAD